MTRQAFILLGTNQGNREQNLETARTRIQNQMGRMTAQSHIYKTEPWKMDAEDWFLNQVVSIVTKLDADQIIGNAVSIESAMGRERKQTSEYESRIIDIDLLYLDQQVIETTHAVVPHPRLHERRFTLVPLCDIAPDFIHPILRKTNEALLSESKDQSMVHTL